MTGQQCKLALAISPTDKAQKAAQQLLNSHDWVSMDECDMAIILGGDGFMLQNLHAMLDSGHIVPAYGMNLGTVGFLMNMWQGSANLLHRITHARKAAVLPLMIDVETMAGEHVSLRAINEISLLRETRQTAKLEVCVNGQQRLHELVCDGVLVATPAGSTAYNLSANGPILPLGCNMLALTPISPFRPRRWKGAILPDNSTISLKVLEPAKRPVSAVADQKEICDIRHIVIKIDRSRALTLLFDPDTSLEERIAAEQFLA